MAVDLIAAIKEKQQRIIALQREIVTLQAELRDAKSLLAEKPKREPVRATLRKRPIRQQSTVWWAKKALQHSRKPMHIDELVKRVEEFSGHNARKTTLVSNLSRYIRVGDTFTRVEEGVYGLLEFSRDTPSNGSANP